ncbi:MAG: hypothetical protein EXS09_05915 [Gemmataceae bacterium]|nr:hypothetical protein [Gemmataceae bacterium]
MTFDQSLANVRAGAMRSPYYNVWGSALYYPWYDNRSVNTCVKNVIMKITWLEGRATEEPKRGVVVDAREMKRLTSFEAG